MTGRVRGPVLAVAVGMLALAACASPVGADPSPGPVVATASGQVRGTDEEGVHRFRGIPYAAAPVGERRWRPPQPVDPWPGTLDAAEPGPVCPQPDSPEMQENTPQDEDCLTLEVTTPAAASTGRPVMVWVPGGGFITGGGSVYDPERLVETGDIVVVTVNYRLGVFGFFAHPELGEDGNFGLQDQVAALRWVRDNISRFGGDPGRVTLAGESAGAMSVCTLMTSPAARGLFQQAIVESGSCMTSHPAGAIGEGVPAISTWHPIGTIHSSGLALAQQLACADLACLREAPADRLLPHTSNFPLIAYGTDLVPDEPATAFATGKQAAVPLLQGTTADEHVEFLLAAYPEPLTGDRYSALLRTAFGASARRIERQYPAQEFTSPTAAAGRVFSDRGWTCPSWRSGRYHAATAPTYAYVFADPSAPTPSGRPLPEHVRPATVHGSELYLLFDFADGPGLTADQRPLADLLVRYWTRFVSSGDPNGAVDPVWPRLDGENTALRLGPDGGERIDLRAAHHCELF
jgi:para-nitrobenzyl esterase